MVQLVRYHETDDSIFLVLQHAVGGKLWTYVGSYLYGDGTRAELPLQDQNDSSSDDTNTYVGKRLLDSRYVPLQLLKPNAEPLNRNYEKEDLRTSWISSNNCSPGYVDLFSDYVASVSAKDRVPLAECQFVTYNKSRKDSRGDGCEIEHSVLGEKPSSDLITDERYDEPHSSLEFFRSHSETEQPFWDGLEHIDPKDLISNAEKLMENVEETLRNSKKG